jgi:hypothetical protein
VLLSALHFGPRFFLSHCFAGSYLSSEKLKLRHGLDGDEVTDLPVDFCGVFLIEKAITPDNKCKKSVELLVYEFFLVMFRVYLVWCIVLSGGCSCSFD